MTDHESTDGVAFAALIGLANMIVAALFALVLRALQLVASMETELGRLKAVVDGVGGLP